MKVLCLFLLAVALCAVALVGCSGDSPTISQLQGADGIQIISPDQASVLVAGRVEEVIFVATSQKPIKSYRVFLCDDTGTNDQEILGSAQILPNLVLYHGILSPELDGTYTIRVEAYGPGPHAIMLLSAISEPFTVIPSFYGNGSSGVEAIIDNPTVGDIWYTNAFYDYIEGRAFDSEKCPVSMFVANYYLSDNEESWSYLSDVSCSMGTVFGNLGGSTWIPGNLAGDDYRIKVEVWTFHGAFMVASDISEPFSIQRRDTGIFSISEPNQQTVWENFGIGTVSGYLVDKDDIPVTGPVQVEFRVYPADPTSFNYRHYFQGWASSPMGDGIIYCDNGQCSFDVQITEDISWWDTSSFQLYVLISYTDERGLFSVATSEVFTIQ